MRRTLNGVWKKAKREHLAISGTVLATVILIDVFIRPPRCVISTYYTPEPSWHILNRLSRFVHLSYRIPGNDLGYYKGRDDAYLLAFWILALCFLREASMRWVYKPMAAWLRIKDRRSSTRFAEQGWSLSWYSASWVIGMSIMTNSPYAWNRTSHYWIGYPHDSLPALTKWYYLVECSFSIQQIIVINVEKRRKDHWQMLSHHIITISLISLSYVLNWTRIGNAVLCLMDISDILLSAAKMILYAKYQTTADVLFGVFLFSWVVSRHVLYGAIIWSVAFQSPRYMTYAWRSKEGYFWSKRTYVGFVALLCALQLLLIIWFGMIVRVAWKVIAGKNAEDVRSEASDNEEEHPAVGARCDEIQPAQLVLNGVRNDKKILHNNEHGGRRKDC